MLNTLSQLLTATSNPAHLERLTECLQPYQSTINQPNMLNTLQQQPQLEYGAP
jgi:hypothetical protein